MCQFKKPIILSTGMNDISSISKAVNILKKIKLISLFFTQRIFTLPFSLVRLGGMQELMNNFDGIPIGLSDHTVNNLSSYAAIDLEHA